MQRRGPRLERRVDIHAVQSRRGELRVDAILDFELQAAGGLDARGRQRGDVEDRLVQVDLDEPAAVDAQLKAIAPRAAAVADQCGPRVLEHGVGAVVAHGTSRLREARDRSGRTGRDRRVDQLRVLREERRREHRRRRVHRQVLPRLEVGLDAGAVLHVPAEEIDVEHRFGLRAAVGDDRADVVAGAARILGREDEHVIRVELVAQRDARRRRIICRPDDVALGAAVQEEEAHVVRQIADGGVFRERAGEIGVGQTQARPVHRPLLRLADEHRDRGPDADDRSNAARNFLDIHARKSW